MKSKNIKIFLKDFSFVLPALLVFAYLQFYPMLGSFFYAFTNWDGVSKPIFIGFRNFQMLLQDQSFLHAAQHTAWIALLSFVVGNVLAFLLALALNKALKMKSLLRTLFYIPAIISGVIVSLVWGNILQYDGLLNALLQQLGLGAHITDWLGSLDIALYSLVFVSLWGSTGYIAVFYLAGLQTIPAELYEAATIDGAKGFRMVWHITLPLLMPVFTVTTFFTLVSSLKFFDLPYILTNGGPGDATSTLALVIFTYAFKHMQFGYASAAGVLFMIAISILTAIQMRVTKKREIEF